MSSVTLTGLDKRTSLLCLSNMLCLIVQAKNLSRLSHSTSQSHWLP
jgi:hypothetical protein